jgi:Leucine-rich repeat (LRR) protein
LRKAFLQSNMSGHQSTSQLFELPPVLLAVLFQHVASGPGGLASAAALSRTCKYLDSLAKDPAVTYRDLLLEEDISSPDHPVWQWLAKRSGRIAGLGVKLRLKANEIDATEDTDHLSVWDQPLQTLCGIPGVQLRVAWVGSIEYIFLPSIAQWMSQHGHLISNLTVEVDISNDWQMLREFAEAAAACRSIDVTVMHDWEDEVDLSDLDPLASSLQSLRCDCWGTIVGTSALSSMSQLTALSLDHDHFTHEEPWQFLASLTSLQQLCLSVCTSGDPSPLSALTRLSSLDLRSYPERGADDNQTPYSFSSLQPLSTLHQLEELQLWGNACGATSLQGLAGLSNIKFLNLNYRNCGYCMLKSIEGISPAVVHVSIVFAQTLVSLDGIEACMSLEDLRLYGCGVSSLQPLKGLSSMKWLQVSDCKVSSLEGMCSKSLQSLTLRGFTSLDPWCGVEHLSALRSLCMSDCRVTSLQPLCELGQGLQDLLVYGCSGVQEEVLELPHVQPTAHVLVKASRLKEVVLVVLVVRRAVGPWEPA